MPDTLRQAVEALEDELQCRSVVVSDDNDDGRIEERADILKRIRALLAVPSPEREETRLLCDTPFDDEVWRCEVCGDEWVFTDGTPEQNHVEYCHACGRKIVAIVRPEPEEDEDTP